VEFYLNPSAIYTKWCTQTFPPIFGLFVIFDGNFVKIVAPPGGVNANHVVHLTEQSLLKKPLKMASKSTHKPSHNTCFNYIRPSVTYKKTPIFAPTAGACSLISPKLCMVIENVVTILKDVNHFSIQRIVFPAGVKMLIFGH